MSSVSNRYPPFLEYVYSMGRSIPHKVCMGSEGGTWTLVTRAAQLSIILHQMVLTSETAQDDHDNLCGSY